MFFLMIEPHLHYYEPLLFCVIRLSPGNSCSIHKYPRLIPKLDWVFRAWVKELPPQAILKIMLVF